MKLISEDVIRKQDVINELFTLKSKYVLEPIKDSIVTECIKKVDNVQGLEVIPIGKWMVEYTDTRGYTNRFQCSCCYNIITYPYQIKTSQMDYDFCPYCGAELVADTEGEE